MEEKKMNSQQIEGRYAGACKTERGRSFPDPSGQY